MGGLLKRFLYVFAFCKKMPCFLRALRSHTVGDAPKLAGIPTISPRGSIRPLDVVRAATNGWLMLRASALVGLCIGSHFIFLQTIRSWCLYYLHFVEKDTETSERLRKSWPRSHSKEGIGPGFKPRSL